ncbi:MAG: hypothetical protein BRC33_09800 [Cyanobacteria bacterium SW_9_44_58]|nr:MAG: hypothetical protein BRC33_09800 [Cyanobacteria bacterium SW_9_44_58]
MSEQKLLIQQWWRKVELADRNNIFCHCRDCGEEWVDSQKDVACANCGSNNLEQIRCWQFPDG